MGMSLWRHLLYDTTHLQVLPSIRINCIECIDFGILLVAIYRSMHLFQDRLWLFLWISRIQCNYITWMKGKQSIIVFVVFY